MKKKPIELFYRILVLTILSLIVGACSDYEYNDPPEDLNLDSNLYGTWSYTNDDGTASWTFNSDGTCIQSLYGTNYDWKWEIESGQLKLFVDSGIPAYKTYKIEGNLLYFWAESISDWAIPFTKQ
ncbi:MAG: DUF5640 domain-containing protein [Bacteroidota bacterium]|nr:DUF5640 domain-containing protein [Bacteroidota bacterium]